MRAGTVQKRNAFTLVELLVVIAIIAILMALTIGVLSKVWQNVDETKTTAEVSKLAESVNLFKGQFGRYPPSRIILAEHGSLYAGIINGSIAPPAGSGFTPAQWQALGSYSVEYVTSLFPGIDLNRVFGATTWVGHDWAGRFPATPGNPPGYINTAVQQPVYYLIEGEQTLPYFLAGIRYLQSAPQGFNTDKTNPTAQSSSARLGPFFTFDEARVPLSNSKVPGSALFRVYNDFYGTPYAYFLARYQGTNNYPNPYVPSGAATPTDCAYLTNDAGPPAIAFVPYFVGTVPPGPATLANWSTAANFQFHKADTFQIISAGRDKLFGTGGQFNVNDPENSPFLPPNIVTPGTPTPDQVKANFDNITNVTGGRVVPQ
jgi:prepilin-type N-terminal cleavage/methylation domain-containing protein